MVCYLLPQFPEIKQMCEFMNVPVHPHTQILWEVSSIYPNNILNHQMSNQVYYINVVICDHNY